MKHINYAANSLLSSVAALWSAAPRVMLREHYRCHPRIIIFCNRKFYNGQLVVLTKDNGEADVLTVYKTVPGNHARGHVNQRQIDVIYKEIFPRLNKKEIDNSDVGIVSPYRAQKASAAQQIGSDGLEIDTVHKFQGREKDTIVLTTVDNEIGEFVDNPKMLNVAVSRAVSRLFVIISDNESNVNTNIGDLTRYIEYNNGEVVSSSVYSIFDMLYKAYSKQRKQFLRNRRRVSEFDSENLMQAVIDDVLSEPEFRMLDSVAHLPLSMLIRHRTQMNMEELNFVRNRNTHLDFVIYHKMDMMPVLVIEVDGGLHREGTRQEQRDKMKDGLLFRAVIPIIRMKTTGSGEAEKLRKSLQEWSAT